MVRIFNVFQIATEWNCYIQMTYCWISCFLFVSSRLADPCNTKRRFSYQSRSVLMSNFDILLQELQFYNLLISWSTWSLTDYLSSPLLWLILTMKSEATYLEPFCLNGLQPAAICKPPLCFNLLHLTILPYHSAEQLAAWMELPLLSHHCMSIYWQPYRVKKNGHWAGRTVPDANSTSTMFSCGITAGSKGDMS